MVWSVLPGCWQPEGTKNCSHNSSPSPASLIAYKAARKMAECTCQTNRVNQRIFKEKTKLLAEDPNDIKFFWSIVKGHGTSFCLTSTPLHTRSMHYRFFLTIKPTASAACLLQISHKKIQTFSPLLVPGQKMCTWGTRQINLWIENKWRKVTLQFFVNANSKAGLLCSRMQTRSLAIGSFKHLHTYSYNSLWYLIWILRFWYVQK